MSNSRMYGVILAPVTSEKSTRMGEVENTVALWVRKEARKQEIKHAVEKLFNVKVLRVHTVTQQAQFKQSKRAMGLTARKKKAYVTLAEGEQIAFAGE